MVKPDKYDVLQIAPLKAYLDRIGAEVLNHRRFMVKDWKGSYYHEKCMIKLTNEGEIICRMEQYAPTEAEAAAITVACAEMDFPKAIQATNIIDLRPKLKGEPFVFIDRKTGGIIMVQERIEPRDVPKYFVPWTLFDDGEWRALEPDGDLPFWKPDHQTSQKIMIHEGPKAARHVQNLISDPKSEHPWKEFLSQYCHWAMIGGALAPHRTDYAELRAEKPTEVIYVCDNDVPGKSALAKISKAYGQSLKGILFGNSFPGGWDLADALPAKFFNGKRYNGPSLETYLVPATCATETKPNPAGKGRPITVLRPDFAQEWFHAITPEVYVHQHWPNKLYGPEEFNNLVRPFSDVVNTAGLLQTDAASKAGKLKYIPHLPSGIDADVTGHYINTHVPSLIKPEKGDATQWERFIEHLITDDKDRMELMRWCSTLVVRPDIRMLYGVLLISEQQGVGKSTLGEKILKPLVGEDNYSPPGEAAITDSNFNGWLAHKRLAVVQEIYSGHSWKAYHTLKSIITDDNITINKKFMATYEIENWIHIFACSNSRRALKIAEDDRRWFVPAVTEAKRSEAEWTAFNEWLRFEGGLGIIRWWMEEFLKAHPAVMKGESAPDSAMKREVIEEAYSPGQALIAQAFDIINDRLRSGALNPDEIILLDVDLVSLIKNVIYEGRHNDHTEKPATIRKIAKMKGWFTVEARAQIRSWGTRTFGSRVITPSPKLGKLTPGDLVDMGLAPSSSLLSDLQAEIVRL